MYPNHREGAAMSRHIDKEALVAAIKQSQELSDEQKADILELISTKKKYGLVWEDSNEDAYEELKTKLPILREVENRRILNDTDSEHYPNHILIEGENLHALVALTYTHAGMIDVIYIDPPYNTGNKDFVYNDSYIDSEDFYRHSKWLSFMKKRLEIAKTLLSEKGVIFISIDDNEQANLKLLCDEVFGYSSYVSTLMIESSVIAGPRRVPAMQGSIVKTAEYCLVYTRNEDTKIMQNLKYDFIDGFDTHYNKYVDRNTNSIISLNDLLKREKTVSKVFEQYQLKINIQNLAAVLVVNEDVKKWLYSQEVASYLYRQGDKEDDDDYTEKQEENQLFKHNNKWYIKTNQGLYNIFRYIDRIGYCDDYFSHFGERTVRGNLWKGFSSDGGNLDKEGGVSFKSGKKPIRLVKQLIQSVSQSNDITILDFFAGSGTTMHAVLQLNAEDGGNRKCIIVTNNENSICEKVTYVRCRNIVKGYGNNKGLTKNNLRYYKLDLIERNNDHQQNRELMRGLKDLLCIKDNIYQVVMQFGSLSLKGKESMLRCFAEGERQMLMVYDSRVIPYLVKEIMQMPKAETQIKIYLFADGAYPYTEDFAMVMDKVQLIPMPYAYLRAVKYSLPEANPSWSDNSDLTEDERQEMMAEAIKAENNENE